MKKHRRIISMLVENKPGMTARVTGLFASRGYNIETICGAPTNDPNISRITISTLTTPEQMEHILKQVRRLIDVIKVRDMTGDKAVKRELAIICVRATAKYRAELQRLVETFRATIVDTGVNHCIVKVDGSHEKINALIQLLEPMGIKKMSRTGTLALYREPG